MEDFTSGIISLEMLQRRSTFRGTRVVRSGLRRVLVFLDREAIEFLSPGEDTKLVIGYSTTLQQVVVVDEANVHYRGNKVYRNKDGSGRFVRTLSDEAMCLLFPDREKTIFVPSIVELSEIEGERYVVLKRDETSLPFKDSGDSNDLSERFGDAQCEATPTPQSSEVFPSGNGDCQDNSSKTMSSSTEANDASESPATV